MQALVLATHFPQALTMLMLVTLASFLNGQHGIQLLFLSIATAAGQASVGWANDYKDAQTDKALNRMNKPSVSHSLEPANLRIPIFVALIILVPFSFLAAGLVGGLANLLAVFSAQAYNLWLSRTIWSWLPYAVSFALLTVFVAQSSPVAHWPNWQWLSIASGVGVLAHIFNALPDLEIDKQAHLGGLVVSLGKSGALVCLVLLFAVLTFFLASDWQGLFLALFTSAHAE